MVAVQFQQLLTLLHTLFELRWRQVKWGPSTLLGNIFKLTQVIVDRRLVASKCGCYSGGGQRRIGFEYASPFVQIDGGRSTGSGLSWSENIPLRKRLNRSVAVVFHIEPGPNALQILLVAADAEWPSLYS